MGVAIMVRVVASLTFSGVDNIDGHDASYAASKFIFDDWLLILATMSGFTLFS